MNRIEELRKARGWRQSDLADILHAKPQTVSRYERGDRGLDVPTIHALCDLFGVSADYLLGRSELPGERLSEDEQWLVRRWRGLSPTGREYLLHTLALVELGHSEKNGAVSDVETAR